MERISQEQSTWRIDMARDLTAYYRDHDQIRMIVLGGSPSRGLSDGYSDLDIIVFWNTIDEAWLENKPLKQTKGVRKDFRKLGEDGVFLESWFYGNLKADFGHITMDLWEGMVNEVLVDLNTSGDLQKSVEGFNHAVPLFGEDLYKSWKKRTSIYPEKMAEKMIREQFGFFVKGCIENQGWRRGDFLYYHDCICIMLRKMLGMLAGLNRVFFSITEPRWLEYELSKMDLKPPQMLERINHILANPGPESTEHLYELLEETLQLVHAHLPEIDISILDRLEDFRVSSCTKRPEI